jgi:hypothetical protein
MSTQTGTIQRQFGTPTLAVVIAAAVVAIGVTVAVLAFQDSSAPVKSATTTEQATAPIARDVAVNTPSETGLIKNGLQPRPFTVTVTAEELAALKLASGGIDTTAAASTDTASPRALRSITMIKGGLQPRPYGNTR